jgi:Domain of Unknown Function (DUF928)
MNPTQSLFSITLITLLTAHPNVANADAFDPPPGQGSPKGTAGGGSRPVMPSCLIPPDSTALPTLLAPKNYLGLTTQTHPTFWVYLPTTMAKTIEFSLFDHNRNGIYQVSLPLPKSAGLIAIPLPKTTPGLTIDRTYHWTIALVCNSRRRTEDWVSGGWIQRQQPSDKLQKELKYAEKPVDRANFYLQSNFWYDAMTTLSQQKLPNSAALTELWSSAFDAAGISEVQAPVLSRSATR